MILSLILKLWLKKLVKLSTILNHIPESNIRTFITVLREVITEDKKIFIQSHFQNQEIEKSSLSELKPGFS